jgi:membrane-associated protease RseP (regulator of RpoE activity)
VLGVSLQESDGRVSVTAVMPGSPAAKAGLRVGDQIRYVGDQRIRTAEGLAEEVSEYRPGSQVDLAIRRDGEKQTVTATLGSRRGTSRDQDRFNRNPDQRGYDQGNRDSQANRGRVVYSYNPVNRENGQPRQQVSQRVRDLQQQVSRIQQELNTLQSSLNEGR